MLLAPIVQAKKGEYNKQLEVLREQGFIRVRINGFIFNLDSDLLPKLDFHKKHDIDVVVDRLTIQPDYKIIHGRWRQNNIVISND